MACDELVEKSSEDVRNRHRTTETIILLTKGAAKHRLLLKETQQATDAEKG